VGCVLSQQRWVPPAQERLSYQLSVTKVKGR
jgi:hypothetical protein